ncbi:ABC transporter permease [Nocardioides sp. KR10-350]|uniref:ABC transporter permease n=1 Tax=Nocardioides cheoyonin TaxID=3156615 RepID=UPI0032B44FC5
MRLHPVARIALGLPALAALAVLFVAPMVNILLQSLHVNTIAGTSSAWTVHNYSEGISGFYRSSMLRSIWISLVVTLIAILIGFPFAHTYAKAKGPGRFVLTLILFLPLLTTSIVTSYGWLIVLGRSGMVNTALQHIGIISKPINFLYSPLGDIIALEEWILPFAILPITGSLAGISPDIYKAAHSLGSGSIRTFLSMTVPLSRAGIIGGAVAAYALSMSSYTTPRLVSGGAVQVLPIAIYNQFVNVLNLPLGSALSILLLVVVLVPVALLGRRSMLAGRA